MRVTEQQRLAEEQRLASQERIQAKQIKPELTPADTPKLSGDSPERTQPNPVGASVWILGNRPVASMTIRESFAATIMAGLALSGQVRRDEGRAAIAVEMADALIAALDASSPR